MHEEAAEAERLDSETPRFMGNYEIKTLLGISRQRVYQITQMDIFPSPVAVLRSGGIWLATDVDDWISGYMAKRHQAVAEAPAELPSATEVGSSGNRQDEDERKEPDGQP